MPSLIAVIVIFALFLVLAAPGLVALSRPKAVIVAVPFYLCLFFGLSLYHIGLWKGDEAAASRAARSVNPLAGGAAEGGASPLCQQAIEQSQQGGLILDRSNPARVVVDEKFWAQLPQQAKDGLRTCLQASGRSSGDRNQVEIIEANRNER